MNNCTFLKLNICTSNFRKLEIKNASSAHTGVSVDFLNKELYCTYEQIALLLYRHKKKVPLHANKSNLD